MPNRMNRLLLHEELQRLAGPQNIVLVGYRGLTATDAAMLRRDVRATAAPAADKAGAQSGLRLRVVRNRITLRALSELGKPDLTDLFDGPTAIMDGGEDPVTVAKAAVEFAKRHPALEIRGGLLEERCCTPEQVEAWSKRPNRVEQLAILVGQVLAPGGRLVGALRGPGGALASQVKQKSESEPDAA